MNTQIIKILPQHATVPTFENFSSYVLRNEGNITPRLFVDDFSRIQRQYLADKQRDLFCSEADTLASQLFEKKNFDLASIIMSTLCKVTQFFPDKLEPFAIKGYEIAKSKGDYVHMMARLNDLRKIYYRRPDKVYQYVQVLYKQEKCLKELTNHYESAIESFHTINRQPAAKRDYQQMLAHVQTEIGKLTKKKQPKDAKAKLLSARAFFEEQGNKKNVDYIDMLLGEIEIILARA